MSSGEILKWRPFTHPDGTERDLSFLDAHDVTYTHSAAGKPDIEYRFLVMYSFHCFTKDYEHQKAEEQAALMYVTLGFRPLNGKNEKTAYLVWCAMIAFRLARQDGRVQSEQHESWFADTERQLRFS